VTVRFSAADGKVLELACLVHDLGDPKLSLGLLRSEESDSRGVEATRLLGTIADIPETTRERVRSIIEAYSFDDFINREATQLEISRPDPQNLSGQELVGRLLFDADVIDAMGAVGIARCFLFPKNRGMYDPFEVPRDFDSLRKTGSYTSALTHFLEKLLKLHALLLPGSKPFALERHRILVSYVCQFFEEYWIGMGTDEQDSAQASIDRYTRASTSLIDEDSRRRLRASLRLPAV
jgi:uncharacterized protein